MSLIFGIIYLLLPPICPNNNNIRCCNDLLPILDLIIVSNRLDDFVAFSIT